MLPLVKNISFRYYSSMARKNGNAIKEAVSILEQWRAALVCGVSTRTIRYWVERGKLPRTEATGETRYAELMAAADPRISKDKLLATVMRRT